MQCGSGLSGGGCDFPNLAVHAALQIGETSGCCVALLFLDVSTAFASMVREVVFPTDAGKEHWLHFLISKGYPPDFAQEVIDAVVSVCDWEAAGLTPHALALLQDFNSNTWFSTELLPGVAATRRGCTAGNPVADLVFIASDTLLAKRLRSTLAEAGLMHSLDDSDARCFFGLPQPRVVHQLSRIAYVDDAVIPVVGPAASLIAKLRSTASAAMFVYENHGLSLNFSAGKSEAVINFHGDGAQHLRNHVFSDLGGIIVCDGFGGATLSLRVVGRYRHLGGVVSGTGDFSTEIAPKMAMVRQTVNRLKRHFLRNSAIRLPKKGQVLQALVLSRGLNLAGTWPTLLPREARCLRRAIVDMLRSLLPVSGDVACRQSDDEILRALDVILPFRLVSLMRLHVAIRLATRAPDEVLALLFAARGARRSWLKALEADFLHVSHASCLSELRGKSVADWFAFFRSDPRLARKVVTKAISHTNWITAEEQDAERDFTTYCAVCGAPALDKQALAVHMCRAHGVKRLIRTYVDNLDCLVCGLRCASRQRLVDHLAEKSLTCSHNYLLRYEPFPADVVRELDIRAREEISRRCRLEGAHGMRIHGPFLPVYALDGSLITSRLPLGPHRRWHG